MNRRAVLAGAGLLGAGGLVAFGSTAPADAASAGGVMYGPAPSGGDDTAALQAALYGLSSGGVVLLEPGVYHISGQLFVPTAVDLQGSGGGYAAGYGTTIRCTAAGAQVYVWGVGATTGNLVIDGNAVAIDPLVRGPQAAAGRTFAAIGVLNSAPGGALVSCNGAQNDAWYLLTAKDAGSDGLVLDQGYGGALFSRCEIASANRYHLRLDNQIGVQAGTSNNVFHQCNFEYTSLTSASLAYLNAAAYLKFDHCGFFAPTSITGPLVDVLGNSTEIAFADCFFQTLVSIGAAIRVDFGSTLAAVPYLNVSGLSHFQGMSSAFAVRKSSALNSYPPLIDITGYPVYVTGTSAITADSAALATLPTGVGTERFLSNVQLEPIRAYRPTGGSLTYASSVPGTTHYTLTENAAGTRTYGGGFAPGDVSFGRTAAHALGVEATSMLVTGHGTTAQRPTAGSALAGALRYNTDTTRLEVCDGNSWQAPSTLTPLPDPVRVYDSRSHDGPIHAGQSRTLTLTNRLPADATGAIVNLTITATSGGGYLTLYPAGHTRPNTSSINWYATGQTLANQATTSLGTNSAITIYAAGTTQYLIDLVAYLA